MQSRLRSSTEPKLFCPYNATQSASIKGNEPLLKNCFFAIVNPAAGGGRSAKLASPALAGLREKGLKIDVVVSTGPGQAVELAREAYEQGIAASSLSAATARHTKF